MRRRLPVVVALLCLSAGPAAPQSIQDRLERLFGPPVSSDGSAPSRRARASRPERPAEPAGDPPALDDIPLPTARPADPAPDEPAPEETTGTEADPADSAATPDEPISEPQTTPPEDPPETVDADADEGAPEDPAPADDEDAEPAAADPDEQEPEAQEPENGEPDAQEPEGEEPEAQEPEAQEPEDGEPDDAAETPPVSPPTSPPAYVPPEEARTEPEPAAPVTAPATVTPEESTAAAAAIEDAETCEAELLARGAEFRVGPSISDGDCGVLRPIEMTRTSAGIAVEPQTQMLCRTALAFDVWVSDALVPAAETILDEGPPEAIRHASTYVCRPRSSESRISEHSRGSAIDIAAIEWSGREAIAVEEQAPGSPEDRFLADIRRAACGPFKTVIGPGTDADHSDHFHFDIAARSNDSTYCR